MGFHAADVNAVFKRLSSTGFTCRWRSSAERSATAAGGESNRKLIPPSGSISSEQTMTRQPPPLRQTPIGSDRAAASAVGGGCCLPPPRKRLKVTSKTFKSTVTTDGSSSSKLHPNAAASDDVGAKKAFRALNTASAADVDRDHLKPDPPASLRHSRDSPPSLAADSKLFSLSDFAVFYFS